jgi:hypothetical protein
MQLFPKSLVAKAFVPALLVAVAQWVIGPSHVAAACGDYVHVGGHSAPDEGMKSHAVSGERTGHREEASGAPLSRLPCTGPQCSGETPRPVEAPATPLKVVVRHWGMLAAPAPADVVERQVVQFRDDSRIARRMASSIYRPPR